MKVLVASLFVDPFMSGSNTNVFRQAYSINKNSNINIEILTNPFEGNWRSLKPKKSIFQKKLIYEHIFEGIKYHLIYPNDSFNATNICSNVLNVKDWEDAVNYGINLLKIIQPDILHLQHRHSLWWLLESAQTLGIKTIYTVHDWGMACQRTVLVKGNGEICNGIINEDKCKKCILSGRSKIGNLNEYLITIKPFRIFLNILFKSPLRKILFKYNIVNLPIDLRVKLNILRLNKILPKINKIIVPSKFGINFFSQFNVNAEQFSLIKWFSDPVLVNFDHTNYKTNPTISYVGRISKEKDVEIIFKALTNLNSDLKFNLNITGYSDENIYAKYLKDKYGNSINGHIINWHSWINPESIYNISDCILILTGCVECGPFTLFESFSYKKPVIAANIKPISENINEGENGYLYEIFSISSLITALINFNYDFKKNKKYIFPAINNTESYNNNIIDCYNTVVK